jgi:hypothetical protein
MAYVDFWVFVDVGEDNKTGKWFGQHQTIQPDENENTDRFKWIRLHDDSVIWIIHTWNYEQGPLPKKYRGLSPYHFTYNFEGDSWTYEDVEQVTWQNIKDERMAKLNDTDWVIVKYTETGESVPQEWLDYRKMLRDFPEIYKDLPAEQAQHILNFTFDPNTRNNRIKNGLSVDIPEWTGDE